MLPFIMLVTNFIFMVDGYSHILSKMFLPNSYLPADKLINYPKLNYNELTDQNKYDLQWYVIGKSLDFLTNKPYRAQIWNRSYVVWKNENGSYIGLDDVCSHKGASLSAGKICNNNVVCPYHGYEFNQNGTLVKVPGICFQPSPVYDVSKYNVIEKNGWIYLNTMIPPIIDNITDNVTDNIFVEPEVESNCSVVFLEMEYNCYSRILSENSLDVMHIAFVHTFGNSEKPNPTREEPPKMIGVNHYKSTYYYEAGRDSIARKVFGVKDLKIENEFILPHTTIARVIFGDFVSTVMTFALPIGEKKSKLFVKTYRNFWQNTAGDIVTRNTMYNTMLQDKLVVETIDSRFMDGKFNMKFDKLQNTYTTFYKRFIHRMDDPR
jgi:phenylpropionate dioxygenase-like ring-hydroxylating dioxygenase large terminal subunit